MYTGAHAQRVDKEIRKLSLVLTLIGSLRFFHIYDRIREVTTDSAKIKPLKTGRAATTSVSPQLMRDGAEVSVHARDLLDPFNPS